MDFENDYEVGYHDELERDWDERYEYEGYEDECYPDPDAAYEDRYEVEF